MKTTKKAKKPTTINKKAKKTASNTKTRKLVAKELTFAQRITRFGRNKFIALTVLGCLLVVAVLITATSISSIIADNSVSNTAVLAAKKTALVAPSKLKSVLSKVNGHNLITVSWETTTANNGASYHSLGYYRRKINTRDTVKNMFNSKVLTVNNNKDINYSVATKRRWLKKYYYHTYIINSVPSGYNYYIDVFAHGSNTYVYSTTSIQVK